MILVYPPMHPWCLGRNRYPGKDREPHDLDRKLTASSGPENLLEAFLLYDHGW
jgi:hypothetical protein